MRRDVLRANSKRAREVRKALEKKEAVEKRRETERKEFQGEGAPMVLGRLINYA